MGYNSLFMKTFSGDLVRHTETEFYPGHFEVVT